MSQSNDPVLQENPILKSYRVTLHEEPGDRFTIVFDCYAEDPDHAAEQAENAYPGCVVQNCTQLDQPLNPWVIYARSEAVIGGGFWSNDHGWCDFVDASRFSGAEKASFNLPIATNQDAVWVRVGAHC